MLIFSVYDSIAKCYNHPFVRHLEGEAIRDFVMMMKTEPNRHDFSLCLLGTFNENTGILVPNSTIKKLSDGSSVSPKVEK